MSQLLFSVRLTTLLNDLHCLLWSFITCDIFILGSHINLLIC